MSTADFFPNTYLAALSNKQLLLIQGPDAAKFLQGQVTCDVKELSAPVSRIGAQCNAKGRILLSFRALQMNSDTIALRLPASMMESAQTTLGKYIVFSKAKLHSGSNSYALFGLFGEQAAAAARRFFDTLPGADDSWVEQSGCFLIQLASDRFECWINADATAQFLAALSPRTQTADTEQWLLLDIAAGIADVVPATIELFTPQELNYQLINGINFRKGCYTGQEIVARLHYRGKLKRHMYRFEYPGNSAPAPGTQVINTSSQQHTGNVVSAAVDAGKVLALVSLLDEHLDQVQVENCPEKLHLLSLPYAIPTATDASE